MIATIFTIVGTIMLLIVIPIAVSILTDDAKSWLPRLAHNLLRRAALKLPKDYSAEFYEEWLSHCEDTPEISGKLWHAISIYMWGSRHTKRALDPSQSTSSGYDRIKRAFDVSCIASGLPLLAPLIAGLALVVSYDGGPAFYSQERLGRGGRSYRIWKLRTMVVNPDEVLNAYLNANPKAAAELAQTGKLRQDPRITKVGRLLRKSSMDELPQLWNVWVGEMSLVGPSPLLPHQKDSYPGKEYYAKRPGITSSWQISDRKISTFKDRAQHDDDYAKKMSFLNDFKLLLMTVSKVFKDWFS
jgi:lipopolysaccharide/colanic/teichoic acid biosynthesis glycosyltransferase